MVDLTSENLEEKVLELVNARPGISEQNLLAELEHEYAPEGAQKLCNLLVKYAPKKEDSDMDFKALGRLNNYVRELAKEGKLKIKGGFVPVDDDHISDANVCVGRNPGVGYMTYYPK